MNKEHGLSLSDIGPLTENVPVGNGEFLAVRGVSASGVLALFLRFPELQSWMTGTKVSGPTLIGLAPDAIAAIIAAGTGTPGDDGDEKRAAELPVDLQLDIIEVIGRLTFRKGFGPFVERVIALAKIGSASVKAGTGHSMTSPPQSKPSSVPATAKPTSGPTLPEE